QPVATACVINVLVVEQSDAERGPLAQSVQRRPYLSGSHIETGKETITHQPVDFGAAFQNVRLAVRKVAALGLPGDRVDHAYAAVHGELDVGTVDLKSIKHRGRLCLAG